MRNCVTVEFKMKIQILCFLIILVQHTIWCRKYKECEDITEPDTVVGSKKNCSKYIFCNGENSYKGECLAGNYFNENTGSCEDSRQVKCIIDTNDDAKENAKQTTKDDSDVKDNENINENTEVDELKNSAESVPQIHEPKCPHLKGINSIKYIAHSESCVAFYTCYNGHAIPMLCPGKMYFNEEGGKCQPHMPESCLARYTVRLNCYKGVYDFVPHPHRCEYYFYCLNGHLIIMRCPNDFTWHYTRGTCVQKSKSNCYFEKSVIYRQDK